MSEVRDLSVNLYNFSIVAVRRVSQFAIVHRRQLSYVDLFEALGF